MNRRQFISSIGRGAILTGLATLSGILIYRKSKITEPCDFDFVCRDCRKLNSCKQPEAVIFKRNKTKKTA